MYSCRQFFWLISIGYQIWAFVGLNIRLLSGMNAYLIIIFLGNNNKSGKYELNVFTALTIS